MYMGKIITNVTRGNILLLLKKDEICNFSKFMKQTTECTVYGAFFL